MNRRKPSPAVPADHPKTITSGRPFNEHVSVALAPAHRNKNSVTEGCREDAQHDSVKPGGGK